MEENKLFIRNILGLLKIAEKKKHFDTGRSEGQEYLCRCSFWEESRRRYSDNNCQPLYLPLSGLLKNRIFSKLLHENLLRECSKMDGKLATAFRRRERKRTFFSDILPKIMTRTQLMHQQSPSHSYPSKTVQDCPRDRMSRQQQDEGLRRATCRSLVVRLQKTFTLKKFEGLQ